MRARKVKCNVTREYGTTSDFYYADDGKYYKTKEIYEEYKIDKEYFEKFYIKIAELLGYTDYRIVGSAGGLVRKKFKESKIPKNELYSSLLEKEAYIKELFGEVTEHSSDNRRVLGIFKIIETIPNSITYGGCYEIRNLDNGEIYIGETLDFFTRINTHASELYANKHHCQALQDAFNEHHDFSHFKFTPLYLYEIKWKNREDEKHNTLYLECAYYLKYKYNKKELYNTVNPYIALKENSATLENYKIDCKRVLDLLLEDRHKILPDKVKLKIKKDLNDPQ